MKKTPPSSWALLIERFQNAFDELGMALPGPRIEALAVDVHTAMSGPMRRFHTLEHVFRFQPRDGIEGLAVLYHDTVYWSVDRDWPLGFGAVLSQVSGSAVPGTVLAPSAPVPFYADVLAVFGLLPGGEAGKTGANELFSALALAASLGADLGRERTLAAAACIEATIPFRGAGCRETLRDRLTALGVDTALAGAWVSRAVSVANQDVGDFRLADTGLFLGGTWNLLPELNPDLRVTAVFTIQAYRKAMEATDRFFGFLTPEVLFDAWGDEPAAAVLAAWRALAATNLAVARRYLWAKLLASALLEAFALATGPDVPLSLFMGAASDAPEGRLEGLLAPKKGPASDPVYQLLETGRSTRSTFDLTNSPVAAWIYCQLTEAERERQHARAREFFAGALTARDFLTGWPAAVTSGLAAALSEFVPTRKALLSALGA